MSPYQEEISTISVLDPRYASIHINSLHVGHTVKWRIWVQWTECAITEITEQHVINKKKR